MVPSIIIIVMYVLITLAYHIQGIFGSGRTTVQAGRMILSIATYSFLLGLAGWFNYPGWPQIILGAIFLISIVGSFAIDGTKSEYRPVDSIVGGAIFWGLLYWGGFFNIFM